MYDLKYESFKNNISKKYVIKFNNIECKNGASFAITMNNYKKREIDFHDNLELFVYCFVYLGLVDNNKENDKLVDFLVNHEVRAPCYHDITDISRVFKMNYKELCELIGMCGGINKYFELL